MNSHNLRVGQRVKISLESPTANNKVPDVVGELNWSLEGRDSGAFVLDVAEDGRSAWVECHEAGVAEVVIEGQFRKSGIPEGEPFDGKVRVELNGEVIEDQQVFVNVSTPSETPNDPQAQPEGQAAPASEAAPETTGTGTGDGQS